MENQEENKCSSDKHSYVISLEGGGTETQKMLLLSLQYHL